MSPAATIDTRNTAFTDVAALDATATAPQWTHIAQFSDHEWVDDALRDISRLSGLDENWDSYGSPPLDGTVIQLAVVFIEALVGWSMVLPRPAIAPVPGGGLQFEWEWGDRALELELIPGGSIEYLKVVHQEPIHEDEVASLEELVILLSWLVGGA